MSQFVDILDAFESALALERELGTLAVEIDPAILRGQVAIAQEAKPSLVVEEKPKEAGVPVIKNSAPAPVATPVAPPIPAPPAATPVAPPSKGYVVEGKTDKPDFLFVIKKFSLPAAEVLFTKMVAAMGYSLDDVCVVRLDSIAKKIEVAEGALLSNVVKRVSPRVIFMFDADVVFSIFPGKNLHRNTWEMYNDIPVVCTHSPEFIERLNTPNNVAGTNKLKGEVWGVLQGGLQKIGKTPPQR